MLPVWSKFRDPQLGRQMVEKLKYKIEDLNSQINRKLRYMEVCGTHTAVISRFGLRDLFSSYIDFYSGPGCPVCVTDYSDMDKIIEFAKIPGVILVTFGDMIKVPGSYSTLMQEKLNGCDIRIIYSPLDSLKIAEDNPDKTVVFVGIGFETTMPAIASSIDRAVKKGLNNYTVLSLHKGTPPAVQALMPGLRENYDGFIIPGHVCVITGVKPWAFFSQEKHLPSVVTGFEPVDLVSSLLYLVENFNKQTSVINNYSRAVKEEGNIEALELIDRYFEKKDTSWRGLGIIPNSGFQLRSAYKDYDAEERFTCELPQVQIPKGCRCGDILMGKITPLQCPLFAKVCTPVNPVGPCMVSFEGSCSTYFKYERRS